ncbi:MAG: oxygen-independent coproporphyrinogen III oxidase [Phyllobacterium sp.]|uniref:oxygen-independent coproporphyrinogen III oxidase n=1 Tax=Phyllobacterium sp. TaxID=1871046 RepID=UPI0030F14322
MDPEILTKYGEVRLPRYTSYPTAPRFSPAIGKGTYGDWLGNIPASDPVSLYLHIPFCRSMCWYCGCHTTISQQDQPITDYLHFLKSEIDMVVQRAPKSLRVGEVHFGGGTPTIIQPDEFLVLMTLLRRWFEFSDATNIAVEIDPRRLTNDMAAALGTGGVARASLGVQTFDPLVQKAINRIQTEQQTLEAVRNLRKNGVRRINFDLIYGLPHQTEQSCVATTKAAIAMKPDRFSVFGYAHIPSFKKHQRMIDETALAGTAGRNVQAEAIKEALVSAGYHQVGLDHFALKTDDLVIAQDAGKLRRNFQGYTTDNCETMIGFGASAIGRMVDGYVQNEVAPGRFARSIGSGELATVKGYRFTGDDKFRAQVIERLMCDFSADIPSIAATHGFDPTALLKGNRRLKMLEDDGVVRIHDGCVIVKKDHRFVIRAVAAAFDAYIEEATRTHSKAA